MFSLRDKLSKNLEEAAEAQIRAEVDKTAGISDKELFSYAQYDEKEAEKTGYSNYSYWGSTVRMFFKNKGAVAVMLLMLGILLFTFIQPHLPGQFDPNTVNNDPNTSMALRNVPPNDTFRFGTNNIGQDLWARIWAGTRTSILIGLDRKSVV